MMRRWRVGLLLLITLAVTPLGFAQQPMEEIEAAELIEGDVPIAAGEADAIDFEYAELPAFPGILDGVFAGGIGGDVIVAGGATADIYRLSGDAWSVIGQLDAPRRFGATASSGTVLYLIGGEVDGTPVATVSALTIINAAAQLRPLPDLPVAVTRASAVVMNGTLYVAGGRDASDSPKAQFFALNLTGEEVAAWEMLEAWSSESPMAAPVLVQAIEQLYLFGGKVGADDAAPKTFAWSGPRGWMDKTAPTTWPTGARAAAIGPSHVFVVGGKNADGSASQRILAYHTITDRWFEAGVFQGEIGENATAVSLGNALVLLDAQRTVRATPQPINPPFPLLDYMVVGAYLLGMLGLGWYFVRRDSSEEFFRGGRHIPWWATGMSLFATGASAISLMAMPGKSYATDWGFFVVSIFSVLTLPIGLYINAPLVRKLNLKTANEYLERRFGVTARLFASTVYIFAQVATRFAAIMLLPALALQAIAGVPVVWGIILMGVITTAYTFLGGLSAVIWTDTIQGFVMCAAVAGCLVLAFTRIDGGFLAGIDTSFGLGKFDMFDLSPSLLRITALAWLINVVIATFGGISDQNFVQRVQATSSLGDARRAIVTQMGVAVPINVLLFGLGTALWLFYRERPELLNPVMETDSVFPFFVAQQLPVGLSGLVMAALLAATMSTVSSAICSVSDLGVNDFYRRFSKTATDRSSLIMGRVLTAVVGALGTIVAIGLSTLGSPSVWDLALKLTGLITNGILGLFWLGLLTRRANEIGAMIGVGCGMATVWALQTFTPVTFLVYQAVGAFVALGVGYVASLIIPIGRRDTTGLTIYELNKPAMGAVSGDSAAENE